jgi:AcrR family transcriptional regulator
VSARRPEPAPSRERILVEAARLFARRGYHATTTRQIAQAVGIRQPSLFHHFPSKHAIVQEILRSDLDEAVPAAEVLASGPGPASVRLYRYLRHDVEHLVGSPYDLRGMYSEEVMGDPLFAAWNRKRSRLHAAVERIVKDGVASGLFLPVDTALAREAIAGILIRALTLYSGGRTGASAQFGDEIASLVLRGLLTEPATLEAVRRDAAAGSGGGLAAGAWHPPGRAPPHDRW